MTGAPNRSWTAATPAPHRGRDEHHHSWKGIVVNLHGQRVVILGGTSGIGLATAKAAARCGAEATVISRQPASVDRALAELPPGTGGRAGAPSPPVPCCPFLSDLGATAHPPVSPAGPLQ